MSTASPTYVNVTYIYINRQTEEAKMELAAKLDEYGKPAWIAVLVLSFIIFWPVGLALLFYMIWSGRMGCSKQSGPGRWFNMDGKRDRQSRRSTSTRHSSGNAAFDEYRNETIRRLEEEQKDFQGYLEQLRMAKDKAEFDQFMNDRKSRKDEPKEPEGEIIDHE
jgi:Protein of unknown function (DUF2852)